jgi:hypothetical protein
MPEIVGTGWAMAWSPPSHAMKVETYAKRIMRLSRSKLSKPVRLPYAKAGIKSPFLYLLRSEKSRGQMVSLELPPGLQSALRDFSAFFASLCKKMLFRRRFRLYSGGHILQKLLAE